MYSVSRRSSPIEVLTATVMPAYSFPPFWLERLSGSLGATRDVPGVAGGVVGEAV